MLYQTVVLYMHQQLEKERSISGVYYILKGKQSIQTIQDAHLFGLDAYYAIYTSLHKQQFFKTVDRLEEKAFIQKANRDNYYVLTNSGVQWLKAHQYILKSYKLDGMQFKQMEPLFYARLLLLIQVWTNAQKNHFSYIPIIEEKEITDWVRFIYRKSKQKLGYYLQALYEELTTMLTDYPNEQAVDIWVNQLTSYGWIGQTKHQLAKRYNVLSEDIQLMTTSVNHFILHKLVSHSAAFPVLSSIAENHHQNDTLTKSAHITNNLLKQQYEIEKIAALRKLKMNTIYDHIVEISLNDPSFSLDTYVEPSIQEEVYDAVQQVKTFKLKSIKEKVADDISYFDIRLVLSRIQQLKEKVIRNG